MTAISIVILNQIYVEEVVFWYDFGKQRDFKERCVADDIVAIACQND